MPNTNLPNWPGVIPDTQACPVPAHDTIQEARKAGAVEGTILAAPLAPATGPIAGPAESMVVVAVKNFWDSPTIKAARNVISTAIGAVLIVFATACMAVWGKGQSIFAAGAIDWRATEISAEVAAGLIIGSALIAWARTKDNNAVK